MNAQALEQATKVIDETIRARCDGVPYVEITVTPDIDEDGEDFLWGHQHQSARLAPSIPGPETRHREVSLRTA